MNIEKVREIIHSNNRIVFLSGIGLSNDSGIPDFRSAEKSYDAEGEFGYSPEDLYSSVFYNTRPDLFFKYYKKFILVPEVKPNAGHFAITELEKQGRLTGIITRNIYGLHQSAGAQNVIELHGTIHNNICTKCGRQYSADYIKNTKGIPTCENCKAIIRPKVGLFGEKIDNGKVTQASNAVASANVFIVAGAHLHSILSEKLLAHFEGEYIIVINDQEHFSDDKATIVIHEKPIDILPLLV